MKDIDIEKLALKAYPAESSDPYNPHQDENEYLREVWIEGFNECLNTGALAKEKLFTELIKMQAHTKLKSMNIYLLEQKENTGYNTFSSCIVIAENEEKAKEIHPASNSENIIIESNEWYIDEDLLKKHFPDIKERINHLSLAFGWVGYADRNKITVKKLGVSNVEKHGVVLSSYHAG